MYVCIDHQFLWYVKTRKNVAIAWKDYKKTKKKQNI